MNNVLKFKPREELPELDDGDGGGGQEITVRVIVEYPQEPEPRHPEPKGSGFATGALGFLIGWWLGGL